MSNKFTIAFQDKKGYELSKWLSKYGDGLKNKRIFYVVKANLEQDKDVFKIGISENGDSSAISRLKDYVFFYGTTNSDNACQGVKLYLLLANVYNPDVAASHAAVRRLETKVIKDFADQRERGRERIHVSIDTLFKYLEENKYIDDIEIQTRKTPRLAEKEQAASSAVKSIVKQTTNRTGSITKYEVEFMRGFRYDRNEKQFSKQRNNEVLTYAEIVQLPRGKTLLDEYILKQKPTTTASGAKITHV